LLAEAHAIRAGALPSGHADRARAALDWAICLTTLGRTAEAEPLLVEARAADDRELAEEAAGRLAELRAEARRP
jgi:hypothetical protein